MGEGSRRLTVRARQRWVVGTLFAVTGLLAVWGGVVAWPYAKARGYRHRIEEGRNPEGYLGCVAALHHQAAVPILEDYALRRPSSTRASLGSDKPGGMSAKLEQRLADVAGRLLSKHYPDSMIPRGMRDYEKAVGRSYYGGFSISRLLYSKPAQADTVERLRAWLELYPEHPARDDALLRIARELESSDPLEALRLLYAADHAPDGDKRPVVRKWFQRVLERYAPADDLERWVDHDCPQDVRSNVLYVIGVKRMREHRFAEARSSFERSLQAGAPEDARMQGSFVRDSRRMPMAIPQQLEECLWFESKEDELSRALDREERAALLHEMGRRCFRLERIFWNAYYYEVVRPGGPEPESRSRQESRRRIDVEDVGLANHYRQAIEFFRQIARDYPDYSRIEDVEYSIPLSLVRLRRAWHMTLGAALDPAIHEGFQRFADKYPKSTMADDALYLAGVHHFVSSGEPRDESVLAANMKRIAEEYPDGDIVRRFVKSNHWLAAAVEAFQVELARRDE